MPSLVLIIIYLLLRITFPSAEANGQGGSHILAKGSFKKDVRPTL
jgi:hypothetical protein